MVLEYMWKKKVKNVFKNCNKKINDIKTVLFKSFFYIVETVKLMSIDCPNNG